MCILLVREMIAVGSEVYWYHGFFCSINPWIYIDQYIPWTSLIFLSVCIFVLCKKLYLFLNNHDAGGTDPPAGAGASPVAQVPTNTSSPEISTPTVIWSGDQVSNHTQPTEVQGADQELSYNYDSDVTSADSPGANNNDSKYVELRKNSPASLDNSPELEILI